MASCESNPTQPAVAASVFTLAAEHVGSSVRRFVEGSVAWRCVAVDRDFRDFGCSLDKGTGSACTRNGCGWNAEVDKMKTMKRRRDCIAVFVFVNSVLSVLYSRLLFYHSRSIV